ncbi:type VI lipase adapter Tla3 domain-containing protein [Paraburkholderia tropica]|uniref:type VI lipase adapter Tla3 domain-containing protein n=1 Tax=Paraburkholderia tropica TaxID=92647 RepID=UPI002AB177B8|nr:DUF2875 family protein [Paraburkholderia tropica]
MSRYLYAVFLGLIVVAGLAVWLPEMYERWEVHQAAMAPPIPTFPVPDPAAYPLARSPLTCVAAPEIVDAANSNKDITPMPTNSSRPSEAANPPRLTTLAILSVGLSLDVFRQGQVWDALQKQDAAQPESVHLGSILPMDPEKYPVTGDAKDMAYDKRKADALELGLGSFVEEWPVPTVTVVRGWDKNARDLLDPKEAIEEFLPAMVDGLRPNAGLHWHRILSLPNGVLCSDTPEGTIEAVFRLFEHYPTLPAVLIYAVDGFNMAATLSTRKDYKKLLGGGTGPRIPGELTDSMVALIVARPERVNWLRFFAPYTKPNANPISPLFTGWDRHPPQPFEPAPFIPEPWTQRSFEEWDALPVLAWLHRPVVVPLTHSSKRLKNDALQTALADGWKQATDGISVPPSRMFYDGGQKPVKSPLSELMPALKEAGSPLDLLESKESYDLTQRLGDTGAASPFVGIALATMATYLNADTSMVVPLRRSDQATLITLTPATPGKKPKNNPFGVALRPDFASSDTPSSRVSEQYTIDHYQPPPSVKYVLPRDPEQMARENRVLDDFIAGGDGIDPLGKS